TVFVFERDGPVSLGHAGPDETRRVVAEFTYGDIQSALIVLALSPGSVKLQDQVRVVDGFLRDRRPAENLRSVPSLAKKEGGRLGRGLFGERGSHSDDKNWNCELVSFSLHISTPEAYFCRRCEPLRGRLLPGLFKT